MEKKRQGKKWTVRTLLVFSMAAMLWLSVFAGSSCACPLIGTRWRPADVPETSLTSLTLAEVSPYLVDAVIAVEDKRFFEHRGLDYIRIFSALISNIQAGRVLEGGSTISQQYVKNAYLGPERTMQRKVREAFLTFKLERQYSKEEILLGYLDTIYFGSGAFGIREASRLYFGIEPKDLDLPQAALLAGIIKSPENFSPLNNPELSINRRNLVLALMYHQQYIDKQQYIDALSQTPYF